MPIAKIGHRSLLLVAAAACSCWLLAACSCWLPLHAHNVLLLSTIAFYRSLLHCTACYGWYREGGSLGRGLDAKLAMGPWGGENQRTGDGGVSGKSKLHQPP